MPKIRNIIIFAAIAIILILIYVFFIKSPANNQADLVSSTTLPNVGAANGGAVNTSNGNSLNNQNFLTLLLSVQNIKLSDSIFSDPAFTSLHDSSVPLTPDPNPGRPNPFAQFGSDSVPTPAPVSKTPNGNVMPTLP